ncbi:hypothetical protein M514_08149 [Trichuris suis]|uniref:Uncharacterized protein n=1 Tax=Trichuris suis TaxID=68888 RepID=A0A085NQZ9_9BILA|nr:hypothetical protein M514_08149 [Trichuris suis]
MHIGSNGSNASLAEQVQVQDRPNASANNTVLPTKNSDLQDYGPNQCSTEECGIQDYSGFVESPFIEGSFIESSPIEWSLRVTVVLSNGHFVEIFVLLNLSFHQMVACLDGLKSRISQSLRSAET